jgi:hypothetical protein
MKKSVWMAALLVLGMAASAQAQEYGVRAGVSADPDQFVFGGHLETAPLIERLSFRPNVEAGVGDDVTTLGLNFELVYSIPLDQQPWRLYFGGGPAANIYWHDGNSDVGGGFNVVFGVQHSRGLFTEFKVGAIDSPDLKFLVGFAFK